MAQQRVIWAEVTLDCRDTEAAARFWSELLGLPAREQSQDRWFQLGPGVRGGPVINIQPVSEEKVGKSRVHLDLWVDDVQSAVALVERLGGKKLNEHEYGNWIIDVMADPEGIEFCLVGGHPDSAEAT
jgi:predicted enzyme related to lactoylglutathione lyase